MKWLTPIRDPINLGQLSGVTGVTIRRKIKDFGQL